MQRIDFRAMMNLKACRDKLTRQQYRTLKGQILAGEGDAAMKGLRRLMAQGGKEG